MCAYTCVCVCVCVYVRKGGRGENWKDVGNSSQVSQTIYQRTSCCVLLEITDRDYWRLQ